MANMLTKFVKNLKLLNSFLFVNKYFLSFENFGHKQNLVFLLGTCGKVFTVTFTVIMREMIRFKGMLFKQSSSKVETSSYLISC